ncbi:MAG: cation:proton antiporter [Acutalibacteraceae bacterium]
MEMLKGESVVAEVTSVILFQVGLSYLTTSPHLCRPYNSGIFMATFRRYYCWSRSFSHQNCFGSMAVYSWNKSQTIHTLLGVLFPILVYLIAEMLEVSGVLAIFIAGMMSSF